jgi:hypothetical protein
MAKLLLCSLYQGKEQRRDKKLYADSRCSSNMSREIRKNIEEKIA